MNFASQVYDALDNATHENGYPHEYEKSTVDTVLQIHDWSGIEGFDPDNKIHMDFAVQGVEAWRDLNDT